jgi:hypothetical protein
MGTSLIQIGTPLPRGCRLGQRQGAGRQSVKTRSETWLRCENAVRSTASKILAHLLFCSLFEHSVGPIAQRGEQTQYNRESRFRTNPVEAW